MRCCMSGRPLVRALPWRLGLELSAVIAGGTRILDRIAAVGGDVFAHRPRSSDLGLVRGRIPCARSLPDGGGEGIPMSPPGRPKGEYRSARREGFHNRPPGRPKGEYRSAQREGTQ